MERVSAPNSGVVTLRFHVGKQYVMLDVRFKEGEDVEEVMRGIFDKENIPENLHIPILAAMDALFQEDTKNPYGNDLKLCTAEDVSCIDCSSVRCQARAEERRGTCKEVPENYAKTARVGQHGGHC